MINSDINGDGIDIGDVTLIANYFGLKTSEVLDLAIVGANFGKKMGEGINRCPESK